MRGGAQAALSTRMGMMRLANRDPINAISLKDAIEHVASGEQLPEHCIPSIEVRLRRVRHEKLAAAGIGTGERHAECSSHVAMGVELVTHGIPRSAVPVAARISRLNHEIRNDAMELLSVEVPTSRERHEAVHGDGGLRDE